MTTNVEMPTVLQAYFEGDSSENPELLRDCFTPDATVIDEGKKIRGIEEIIRWKAGAKARYSYTVVPLRATKSGSLVAVTSRLTGNFPGSPIEVTYTFTLNHDKIAKLEIE